MSEQEIYETTQEQPKQNVSQKQKSALALTGFILGIIAVSTSFIPIVNNASFVLGILAAVFGIIALVKRKAKVKALVAIILGVAAIIITLAMQASWSKAIDDAVDEFNDEMDYLSGGKTDDILKDHLDVTIGKFNVTYGEFLNSTELSVTLKNKSSEAKSFSVTVEAIDELGNRIGSETVYANQLQAGQGQAFKVFELVSDEKIEAYKKAKFRVVEVSMY